MVDSCRSSGVLTASAVIAAHQCKLKSIHFSVFAGGPDIVTIKVFDSKDSTLTGNTELARLVISNSELMQIGVTNLEYDMHGVLAREGLFLQITNSEGSPDGATFHAVSVEFN
tara:strand:+ start:2001 stop:2339 length:339 start_codon:yes stop_codon:yes gene_type:complete